MVHWHTVERYARWRRNIRWRDLPDDIVLAIASHLGGAEVHALVAALTGDGSEDRPLTISPLPLRDLWVRNELWRLFASFIHSGVADEVLHDTRSPYTSTVLIFDWSCFSRATPNVIVEFSWEHKRACIRANHERFMGEVLRHSREGLPVVRVTFHRTLYWNGSFILNPTPAKVMEYQLIPPKLMACVSC
tara:strand:+ start:45 stop:614 length:570 start_codon:yes stop_codon:yes gene_type:complete